MNEVVAHGRDTATACDYTLAGNWNEEEGR